MPRERTFLTALLIGMLVLAGCAETPSETDDAASRAEDLERELDQARSRASELEAEVTRLEEQLVAAPDAEDDEEETDDGDAPDEPTTDTPDGLRDVAEPRTAAGLIDQLRVHVREAQPDTGLPAEWEPEVTTWGPYEVPEPAIGTYETPGAVVAALARASDAQLLGRDQWETTIRVLMDEDDPDLAYGAVLSWGYLDDAVRGRDVRITLTRNDDGQWQPGGAEQRFHCLRGLADEGELCV